MTKMLRPNHEGHFWYRDRHGALWCIRVERKMGELRGWAPAMGFAEPIHPESDGYDYWLTDGQWLGEAIPPKEGT